jgi:hypothetical protein
MYSTSECSLYFRLTEQPRLLAQMGRIDRKLDPDMASSARSTGPDHRAFLRSSQYLRHGVHVRLTTPLNWPSSPNIELQNGAFRVNGWNAPRAEPSRGWGTVFLVYASAGKVPPLLGSYSALNVPRACLATCASLLVCPTAGKSPINRGAFMLLCPVGRVGHREVEMIRSFRPKRYPRSGASVC